MSGRLSVTMIPVCFKTGCARAKKCLFSIRIQPFSFPYVRYVLITQIHMPYIGAVFFVNAISAQGIVLTTFSITAAFKTCQELIESVTRPLRRPGAILVILHTLLIRIELHKVGFIFRKISFNPQFLSLWNLNLNFSAHLSTSTCIFNNLPRNHGFVIKALSGNRLYFLSFVYLILSPKILHPILNFIIDKPNSIGDTRTR